MNQFKCLKCGFIEYYLYIPKFFKKKNSKKWSFRVKRFCPDCGILIVKNNRIFIKQTDKIVRAMQSQIEERININNFIS